MRLSQAKIWLGVVSLFFTWSMQAQEAGSGPSTVSSEGLRGAAVRVTYFSGVVRDAAGKPQTGMVGITFSLYEEGEGGVALWAETQHVQLHEQGRYSVFLGSMRPEGLPLELNNGAQRRPLEPKESLNVLANRARPLPATG
jgi:hypothetical protein